jgi:hypothetical protein
MRALLTLAIFLCRVLTSLQVRRSWLSCRGTNRLIVVLAFCWTNGDCFFLSSPAGPDHDPVHAKSIMTRFVSGMNICARIVRSALIFIAISALLSLAQLGLLACHA